MSTPPVRLKVLLRERHWQTYQTFSSEYDKAASRIDRSLAGYGPSRTQFYRWLSGEVKSLPYPHHCRVLEEMFPGWTAEQLLEPVPETELLSGHAAPTALQPAGEQAGGAGMPACGERGEPAQGLTLPTGLSFSALGGVLAAETSFPAADPQAVAALSEALPHYARTANILGSRHLAELAERNVRFLYLGAERSHGHEHRRALDVCARYAEFLGWLHQDLGNPVYSLFWMDRALEWAEEAGADPQFRSYILMRKSDHAEHYGTAGRVLALAQSALSFPALSPRARALALQQEARGYSQRGEAALFERKLDEARQNLLRAEGSADAPWGEYCDLTYLAMQEASGRIDLGQFGKAIVIIERELPAMTAAGKVDSMVFQAKLARAYAEAGSADCAARTALAVCDGIPATGSARVLAEIAKVRRMLRGRGDAPEVSLFASRFDSIAGGLQAEHQRGPWQVK